MGVGEGRGVVAFCIPGTGHIHRMLPIVAGLCDAGVPVHFFANIEAQAEIERTGARFVDLYAGRGEHDDADPASLPRPIRCVTFAGRHGDAVVREVAPLRPGLVLHDTFAVIGRVVAFHLGIPRVNARAGAAGGGGRPPPPPRGPVFVSPECEAAVRTLRQRHGIPDASPFSFRIDQGADLTVCSIPPEFGPPEFGPPEFGTPGAVDPAEPVAFFGSYWPARSIARTPAEEPFGPGADSFLRVYVSFGTAVWHHFEREAMAALEVLAEALGRRPEVRALISLGGHDRPAAAARLARPNVRVEPYVDQIHVLRTASVYVTHHGLNSTHEALYHGVPMISYPFAADQPGTAARCRELGLAVPLGAAGGGPITVEDVERALAAIVAGGDALRTRLAMARAWETAVIDRRPEVIRRITALIR